MSGQMHTWTTLRLAAASLTAILCCGLLTGAECAPPPDDTTPDVTPVTTPVSTPVTVETSRGTWVIEFDPGQARESVGLFLEAVAAGYYDGTIVHEASPQNLVAGIYNSLGEPRPERPLANESNNGRRNLRGTVALFGPFGQSSGLPAFRINLADLPGFDFDVTTGTRVDYTVIGRVTSGMAVADEIGASPTRQDSATDGTSLNLIPDPVVVINRMYISAAAGTPSFSAPVANAGPDQAGLINRDIQLDGRASNDPDAGDALTYAWAQTSGPTVALTNPNTATPILNTEQVATLVYELTVSDRAGRRSRDSVTITVDSPRNAAPVANAGPDQSVSKSQPVTLNGFGSSDPDILDTLSYQWAQISGDEATLSSTTAHSPTFTAPSNPGVLIFELTVTDARGGQASDQVSITVLDNSPPAADAGTNQTVEPGDSVTLDGSGSSDPDSDTLTYHWQLAPEFQSVLDDAGLSINLTNADTAQASFTVPAAVESLNLTFELTVTDAGGATDTDTVDVHIAVFGFQAAASYAVGDQPLALTAGDFNEDGWNDLAVANAGANTVSVLINRGSARFADAVNYNVGTFPASLVSIDVDADGDVDVVAANRDAGTISVLINNGSGTFSVAGTYAMPGGPISLAAGTLDTTAGVDLAAVGSVTDLIVTRMNDGDGAFSFGATAPTTPLDENDAVIEPTTGARALAVANFDSDSDLDIVVVNNTTQNASVLLNDGSGVFESRRVFDLGNDPVAVAAGDLDGDSDNDVVVANAADDEISVRRNGGNANFSLDARFAVGDSPAGVAIANLDGDADQDVVTANKGADTVSLLLNKGSGAFEPDRQFSVGDGPAAVIAVDLDGDGDVDIATANENADTVSVLVNTTGSGSSADETRVRLRTSLGDVVIKLLTDETPVTAENFIQYAEDGFYNGTIFHRVIPGFVVQGGGQLPGGAAQVGKRDPIVNEFSATRSNVRGTLAMAKLPGDPDSATSEFFFNLEDNSANLDNQNGGFTVFARVVEGMDVVDAIAAVPLNGEVPVDDVILISATLE